jgi:hypothetical protein
MPASLRITPELSNNPFCSVNTAFTKPSLNLGQLQLEILRFLHLAASIQIVDSQAYLMRFQSALQ